MKKLTVAILLSLALGVMPSGVENASAADFAVPHTFQGGGVVSADELNERLDNLEQQMKAFAPADLVGTWSCPVVVPNQGALTFSGWTLSSNGLYYTGTTSLTITLSGDTLTMSATGSRGLYCSFCGYTSSVQLFNGTLLYGTSYGSWNLRKLSNTRFEIWNVVTNSGYSNVSMVVCDKQNIPPLKPSNLVAAASGTSITLTWTDNSADETGFDVLRKDTASGTYAVVGSVTANTATYLNSPVTAGAHWYRVRANNANGSSLGSNVVKVTN